MGYGLSTVDFHVSFDGIHKRPELEIPTQSSGGMKILADALAQIPRLAHVDHRAEPVFHEVHTRSMRQFVDLLPDGVGRRHRINLGQTGNDATIIFAAFGPGAWPRAAGWWHFGRQGAQVPSGSLQVRMKPGPETPVPGAPCREAARWTAARV